MLTTVQCHQPLPVGASGSYTVIAKLFVPSGAPLHDSAGEMFLPVQPKPPNTWSMPIVLPSLTVGDVSVKPGTGAESDE